MIVMHGTNAYSTLVGEGLYSLEYMWNRLPPQQIASKVLGGRPYPGIVQNGKHIQYEDGLWVTIKFELVCKMALRAVQQRLWTPEANQQYLRELEKQCAVCDPRNRHIVEQRIDVLCERERVYRALSPETRSLMSVPMVTFWEVDKEELIFFLEKAKRGTMVVKDGHLPWHRLTRISFPQKISAAQVQQILSNVRSKGANPTCSV